MKKLISALAALSLAIVLGGPSVFADDTTTTTTAPTTTAAEDKDGKKDETTTTTTAAQTEVKATPNTSSAQVGYAALSLIVSGSAAAIVVKRKRAK